MHHGIDVNYAQGYTRHAPGSVIFTRLKMTIGPTSQGGNWNIHFDPLK